jgi:hypothetical protein
MSGPLLKRSSFPFTSFLLSYLQIENEDELFGGNGDIERERAQELWDIISGIFNSLRTHSPFESLRNDQERARYLL